MRKLLYACYHLLILLVVGAGVFLSAEVLHAQSLAELVSALPEGTIPFLDREARESLLSCSSMGKKISITPSGAPNGFVVPASASSDQGSLKANSVHAFGQLVPLEIIHCTESYLSFRTGEVIHVFAALPYGNRRFSATLLRLKILSPIPRLCFSIRWERRCLRRISFLRMLQSCFFPLRHRPGIELNFLHSLAG